MVPVTNSDYSEAILRINPVGDVPTSFRPSKTTFPMGPVAPPVSNLIKAVEPTPPASATPVNPSGTGGTPKVLLSLGASQTPVAYQTHTISGVFVNFTWDTTDPNFDHVNVWIKGYHGSTNPLLVASGNASPLQFQLDATGETVVVIGQTASAAGKTADVSFALSTTVKLSGVITNPPSPTISQVLTATPLGYQFSFNQVVLPGGDIDVILAYRIYKNSSNTFSGATLLRTFPHDPTHAGAIVVQDNVGGGHTFYYFVTSVDTASLESTATSAQSGAVVSGAAVLGTDTVDGTSVFGQTASGLSYRPLTNPLTGHDAGASATINIASFTMRTSSKGDISITSGSITSLAYGTGYYIYYDDPTLAGGAVTYNATVTKTTALQGAGRFFVGSITTPAAGAIDTVGNNDGGAGAQNGGSLAVISTIQTPTLGGGYGNISAISGLSALSNAAAASEQWSGFIPQSQSPASAITLTITSQVAVTGAGTGNTILSYSTDGGSTFTTIYNSSVNRALTTDVVNITLPATAQKIVVFAQNSHTGGAGTCTSTISNILLTVQI